MVSMQFVSGSSQLHVADICSLQQFALCSRCRTLALGSLLRSAHDHGRLLAHRQTMDRLGWRKQLTNKPSRISRSSVRTGGHLFLGSPTAPSIACRRDAGTTSMWHFHISKASRECNSFAGFFYHTPGMRIKQHHAVAGRI